MRKSRKLEGTRKTATPVSYPGRWGLDDRVDFPLVTLGTVPALLPSMTTQATPTTETETLTADEIYYAEYCRQESEQAAQCSAIVDGEQE